MSTKYRKSSNIILITIVILFQFFLVYKIHSESLTDVTLCDKLTADETDEQRVTNPVYKIVNPRDAFKACYREVEKNPNEIRFLFQMARVQVIFDTKNNDFTKSIELMRKAANHGYAAAQIHLGKLLYMTSKTKFESEKYFHHWILKAAKNNNSTAQLYLGELYLKGIYVKKDISIAEYWFEKSSDRNLGAKYKLSDIYIKKGDKKLLEKAIRNLEYARSKDHIPSIRALGQLYLGGAYVKKNVNKAIKYLKYAAERNDKMANLELAEQYRSGENIEKNERLYLYYLCRSGEQGVLYYKLIEDKNLNCNKNK